MGKADKAVKKAKKVVESSSDDDSSSEEVPIIANKNKKSKVVEKAKAKAKKVESSDDSDSSDTPVAPKKKVAAKKVVKKAESSDDDSSSEEEVKPKKAVKKVVVKKQESSDDSSSEEVVKAAPKKAAKKVVKKAESSDDSSSEEEVKPKKAVKKASKQVESSDDSSSEEEVKPKKAVKKASKQVESSDDSSEEEVKPKKKASKQIMEEEKPATGGETLEQNNGKWEACVRGLSYDADENDIGNWFEEKAGSVEAVKLLKDRETQRSRGMAFVCFEDMEGLRKAIALNGEEHMGRTLRIDNSANKDKQQPFQQQNRAPVAAGESTTCFIGNLTYTCDEQQMKDFFGSCGDIVSARIAKDRETQKSRGFGHIDFGSTDAVKKALELAGNDFNGRPVKVDVALPRTGGGGDRGGSRGGRGGRGGAGSNLSANDRAAKKGNIVAFQGAKKTL